MDRDRTYPLWRFGCPEKICTTKQLQALKFDGWIITDDPLHLSYGGRNLFVDLGAEEPTIAAEKQGRKIAVEIKSFLGASDVHELSASLGQYSMYRHILYEIDPSRELYLAIPAHIFDGIFQEPLGQLLLHKEQMFLLVFEAQPQRIRQWIP